jgi:hypothetical protein
MKELTNQIASLRTAKQAIEQMIQILENTGDANPVFIIATKSLSARSIDSLIQEANALKNNGFQTFGSGVATKSGNYNQAIDHLVMVLEFSKDQ